MYVCNLSKSEQLLQWFMVGKYELSPSTIVRILSKADKDMYLFPNIVI